MAVRLAHGHTAGPAVSRLLSAAPVAVHVAPGVGGGRSLTGLRADHRVRVASSPRHAELLVLAGAFPVDSAPALRAVHDQLPAPRGLAAVAVGGDLSALGLGKELVRLDGAPTTDDAASGAADPVRALLALRDDVLAGRRDRSALGPAESPVDWRGVGPHGQGGEGMMGGTPYGRPMAMPPVEGRDGLALDRLSLRLGPVLPGLPPGVCLEVGLQGDVLAEAQLLLAGEEPGGPGANSRGTVGIAGTPRPDPRPAPEQEAGRRLEALAELCALAGLDAEARRVARVALNPTPGGVARLRRRLDRPWTLRAATDGIGALAWDGRDVTGRWRRWLDEATGALDPDGEPTSAPACLDPRGRADVGRDLVGLDVGQALLTVASLRPELEHTVADLAVTEAS